MWLTGFDPLLHAPARKDTTHIISSLIFLERCRRGNISLAGANLMNFIQPNVRIIQLKTTSKAQSLVNDFVTINKRQRRDGFRSKRITNEWRDTAFRKREHDCVHPIGCRSE